MSKGSNTTSTVEKADPWIGVQEPLKDLYARTGAALSNIRDYYPGQTFPNFTPLQEAGMFGNLDYAQNYYAPATAGFQSQLGQYMDAPLNITNDPAVQNMMEANANRVTDWLSRKALPSIRHGAVKAGQYGGSRQGIAEGIAIGDAAKALANANARTALGAYGTASQLASNAMGQFPNALEMGFRPGDLAAKYGSAYQDLANRAIQEQMTRYQYPEETTWRRLSQAGGILSGYPVGSTSSTTQPGGSALPGLLGIGNLGLSAYNALGAGAAGWGVPLAAGASAAAIPAFASLGGGTIAASLPAIAAPTAGDIAMAALMAL